MIKKIIFALSIFCLIALSSCNNEPEYVYDPVANSNAGQVDNEETNDSNKDNTSNEENDDKPSDNTTESKKDKVLPEYDDGDTWGEPF